MSARAIMAALTVDDPDLTPSDRNIFAYLVGRANGARCCWMPIDEIQAAFGGISRHTVCSATGKLHDKGYIRVQRQRRGSNTYHILDPDGRLYGDQEVQKPAHRRVQKPAHQESPYSAETRTPQSAISCTPQSAISCTPHLSKEESKRESKGEGEARVPARDPVIAPGQIELVMSRWNDLAQQSGLPPIRWMGGERRKKVVARLHEYGFDVVCDAISRIAGSQFLLGQGGGREGWHATFDFLMKPGKIARILEGNYDNRDGLSRFEQISRDLGTEGVRLRSIHDRDDSVISLEEGIAA